MHGLVFVCNVFVSHHQVMLLHGEPLLLLLPLKGDPLQLPLLLLRLLALLQV